MILFLWECIFRGLLHCHEKGINSNKEIQQDIRIQNTNYFIDTFHFLRLLCFSQDFRRKIICVCIVLALVKKISFIHLRVCCFGLSRRTIEVLPNKLDNQYPHEWAAERRWNFRTLSFWLFIKCLLTTLSALESVMNRDQDNFENLCLFPSKDSIVRVEEVRVFAK